MKKEDFIGKICPYCKTTLNSNDDIVICSICNMPHHKECWIENQGCTTFGCTGTIMNPEDNGEKIDEPTNVQEEKKVVSLTPEIGSKPMFCSKCGAKRKEESKFCRICGVRFNH